MILLCLLVGLAGLAHAADLFRGMTEPEIIEAIGPPNSEMGRSSKKVLMYTGGSLELRLGRLNTADGFEMDYMAPDGVSQFAYMTGRGWTLNGEPIDADFRFTADRHLIEQTKDIEGVTVYSASEEASTEAQTTEETAEPDMAPIDQIVEENLPPGDEMEDGEYDDYYDDEFYDEEFYADFELTPMEQAIELAISFFITLGLTIFIVKMAFEQKGFPVLIPQLLLVSVALSITSLGADLLMAAMNFDSWQVAQLIDYIALSCFIMLFTDVKQAQTAMTIALIARSVTFVVNWVLLMLLLNYGFGY